MMWVNKTKIRRKVIKKIYQLGFSRGRYVKPEELVSKIRSAILDSLPFSLGRIGVNEINAMLVFGEHRYPDWLKIDKEYVWKSLNINVGVFPKDKKTFEAWSDLYDKSNQEMDAFITYYNKSEFFYFRKKMKKSFLMSNSAAIHPMLDQMNWMECLGDKKVLIVAQNINAIKKQLKNKEKIWKNGGFKLPRVVYQYIKPSFSPAVDPSNNSKSWFDELDRMKEEMDQCDYDVALIGAGGYANPLALHAKKMGKVGINMGGAIDPLFGIKTKRYENGENRMPNTFMNEHWIRPLPEDKPAGASKIEGACYW